MRIARWQHGGTIEEGFVIGDAVVPFPDGRDVSGVLRGGLTLARDLHDAVADSAGRPLAEVELLIPLVPAAIRDFAAYEEHVEGMSADEHGVSHVPEQWYTAPTFYFTNPHTAVGGKWRKTIERRMRDVRLCCMHWFWQVLRV